MFFRRPLSCVSCVSVLRKTFSVSKKWLRFAKSSLHYCIKQNLNCMINGIFNSLKTKNCKTKLLFWDRHNSRHVGSTGVYTLIRVESVHCHPITHRPCSFRSDLIAYFMSELFLLQRLHCMARTNTFLS